MHEFCHIKFILLFMDDKTMGEKQFKFLFKNTCYFLFFFFNSKKIIL